jgi:hypothetical protein
LNFIAKVSLEFDKLIYPDGNAKYPPLLCIISQIKATRLAQGSIVSFGCPKEWLRGRLSGLGIDDFLQNV